MKTIVKVGKLSYFLEDLTLAEKVRLGLNKEVVKELKEIQPEEKKSPAKKQKREDNE